MKHPFAMREGQRVAVIRPHDPELALRLTDEHIRTEDQRTPEENQAHFNAILSQQDYTFVGFLARAGKPHPKLLDTNGWAIGEVRPGDSFVPESDIERAKKALDDLHAKWTSEGIGTKENPCTAEQTTEYRKDKFCRCGVCKAVSLCTATNDFYGTAPSEIRCPACYAVWLNENAGKGDFTPDPSGASVKGWSAGKCPCGALIGTSLKGDEPHVSHALPVCKEFAGMSPDEYVAWVRRQRMD